MRIKLAAVHGALLVVGVILLASISGLLHGSNEMFPSQEQQEKARIFWGVFLILSGIATWLLMRARRKIRGQINGS